MDLSLNSILRGVSLPKLKHSEQEISHSLQFLKHYSKIESTIPPMKLLFDISDKPNICFENDCYIEDIRFKLDNTIKGNCSLTLKNGETVESYMKVTHLVDPVHFTQEKYTVEKFEKKINDPCNQAYVETFASYLLGKLRKEEISPHFNLFYGGFISIADKYSYNISDEVESYRKYRWFWNSIEKNDIKIEVECDDEVLGAELMSEIMNKPEFCIESSNEVVEELIPVNEDDESQSIHTLDSVSLKTERTDNETESESEDEESDEDDDPDCNVFMSLQNFPVMMIFTEKNVSTMDDLLEDYDEVGAKIDTEEWEERWSAWLFQIIASLSVIQTLFKFTHNDLHTNNIVWEKTESEYLYYKTIDNKIYKVPTYGKIFKLIDFGRSIFSFNDHIFISDDFYEGNDADTQYNFDPLNREFEKEDTKLVYPNFSFDLSRLSISLFESLFEEKPRERLNAKILSKEDGRTVKETVSELYNMLWSWLIDDEGKNILFDENDDERFPDFQLYVHISAHCKNAVPKEQLKRKMFQNYLLKKEVKLSNDIKIYPLYV